jgi:ABC-type nickel/cobalt efflux system permease component RcnA
MAKRKSPDRIPLDTARNNLTVVWFVGAALSFILLAAQSILGKFETLQEVWGWYTPTVFPTSALILGVIGATALQPGYDKRVVKTFFFKLSRALSAFYLLILLLTMLLAPFSPLQGMALFTKSNYWLSPIQSLVVAAITVLFTSHERGSPALKTS